MNEKGRQTKLLAAIAVLVMVVCVFAVAMPSDDVEGAEITTPTSDFEPIGQDFDWSTIAADTTYVVNETVTMNGEVTLPETSRIYVDASAVLTIDDSSTKDIAGDLYIVSGGKLVISSTGLQLTGDIIVGSGGDVSLSSSQLSNDVSMVGSEGSMLNLSSGSLTMSDFPDTMDIVLGMITGEVGMGLDFVLDGTGTLNLQTTVTAGERAIDLYFGEDSNININEGASVTVTGGTSEEPVLVEGNITNNGALIVESGAYLQSAGSITNNGTFTNNGTLNSTGTFTNAGTLSIGTGATTTGKITQTDTGKVDGDTTGIEISADVDGMTGIDQNIIALSDPVTIEGNAYLAGDVTIPADRTMIITSSGNLQMNGFDLRVEGTLIVENRGVITALNGDASTIYLMRNGSIQNNGTIGSGEEVTIEAGDGTTGNGSYSGEGRVTILNVTGINFGLVRDSTTNTYTLSVSGDISKARGTTNEDTKSVKFEEGAIINGATTATKDVTIDGQVTIVRGGSLTTSGPLSAEVELENGTSVNVNGLFTGKISAQIHDGIAADSTDPITATQVIDGSSNTTISATGFGIEVKRTQYSDELGNVFFDQRAYLTGNIGTTERDTPVIFTIEAPVFVEAEVTVIASADVTIGTSGNGILVVYGTVQNVDIASSDDHNLSYVGAYYEITAEGTTDPVGYISGFDIAIEQIADVDDQTLTLSGTTDHGITISGNATIADGQIVEVVSGNTNKFVTIAETSTVTVEDGGFFDGGMIADINGKLVVMDGGDCTPAEDVYDVKSTDEDNNITYAGLSVILSEAGPGDVITVTGPNATATNITVPNGVTLEIEGTLTVSRSVTVAEGGILTVKEGGTLIIGTDADTDNGIRAIPGTLTVAGTADVTEGTLTMRGGSADENGTKASIGSTGGFTYLINQTFGANYDVNGAYYMNTDGNNVLTTVAKAIEGATADEATTVTVIGTVNDSTDVALGGITLNVNGDASLGSIDVQGSTLNITGELTATITGIYGDEGSTGTAAIGLVDATVASISNNSRINAQNVNVWYMNLGSVTDGTVTISQGTVTATGDIADDTTDEAEDVLSVASGATLSVNSSTKITNYAKFTVEGALEVTGTLTVDNSVEEFTVSGTMTVDGTATADNMNVTGTLTVTNNENTVGSMTVNGQLAVGDEDGSAGTVEGTVGLNTAGYVLAYPGSTVSESSFGNNAKFTEFFINGALYFTAYTENDNSVVAIGTDGFMANVEVTGYVTENYINDVSKWYADEALETPLVSENVGTFSIGAENAAYIELEPDVAYVQYSVGSQISLYVDGVRITSGDVAKLSVGTHQVTATVNPGYTGTVDITFNGQAVDGTFTITPEMSGNTEQTAIVLSAIGEISQDSPVINVDGGNGGDDGMGLTDILLIILVILIVVMAIIVALRLMRS